MELPKTHRELWDFEYQLPWRLRHLTLALLSHGPVVFSLSMSLKLLNSESCSAVSALCDISHESKLGPPAIEEGQTVTLPRGQGRTNCFL